MKRLDLSVGQRLLAGTVVVAVLVAILGAVLVTSVARVSALRREKLEIIAPRARAANDLERAVYTQAVLFRNFALTNSPADRAAFERSAADVRRQLEATAAFPKGPAGRALFEQVVPIVDEHQRSFDGLARLVTARASKAAIDEAEEHVSSHREEVMRKVRAFAALQAQRSDEADRAINAAIDDLRLSVIVVTLLILAASIATTWVVGRTVREPATRLIGAAEAMRAGDFDPALHLEGDPADRAEGSFRDELREAAHVFGRMARSLRAREKRLEAQSRLSAALSASLEPSELATHALREVTAHTGAAIGAVYVADADRAMLRSIATVALGNLERLPIGSGIPGQAAAEGRSVVVRDLPADARFGLNLGFGTAAPRCCIATPMKVGDRLVGVLLAGTFTDFDNDAIAFIEHAADQVGVALDNAASHVRIAGLARELEWANESLQAQNEELQVQGEELQAQNEELQAQQEELQAQQDSLERTNEALERAEAQKNRFLAVLGHELRNPLAAIAGATEMLGDGDWKDEDLRRNIHDVITRQTRHLGRLLDDLLDLGRITNGKVGLNRRPMDLAAAAQRCVRVAAAEASQGPRIRIDAAEPAWIDADETRVEQIITNLLTNAIKYTPLDGTVFVRVAREAGAAVLMVSDTGAGIPREHLSRVFDLFFQGNDPETKGRGGLGIGLSLVRDLVQMHGGTINAESDGERRGTTMTVRFPALADQLLITPGAPPPRTRAPRSVVVVEDNDDVRHMMKLMLRRAGHTVAEADDGPAGVETITTVRPDVALVDLDLPGFDGCEVARRLRRDSTLNGLRLIALSGYGRPEDRARALAAGFDEHLVKPVDMERLMTTLEGPGGPRAPEALEGLGV